MGQTEESVRPVSVILTDLSADRAEADGVPLGHVAAKLGSRVHGAAILILALPETIPAPLPGLSGILGVPLFFVSLHLAVFGEGAHLPARARLWQVPGKFLSALARYGAPVLVKLERLSYARLPGLARRERLVGWVCVLWALVLWLPIPFLNLPPAALLVLLAWGLIQRDGLFVLIGLLGSVALILASLLLGEILLNALAGWGLAVGL